MISQSTSWIHSPLRSLLIPSLRLLAALVTLTVTLNLVCVLLMASVWDRGTRLHPPVTVMMVSKELTALKVYPASLLIP